MIWKRRKGRREFLPESTTQLVVLSVHSACGQSGGRPRHTTRTPPLARELAAGTQQRTLPVVRVDALLPVKIGASTRSLRNIEISAKIPITASRFIEAVPG